MPIRSANFYEWNEYFEELDFAQDWREAMIARGAPETIGMLIDTGRNGWGGADRPTGVSESTSIETHVNDSRIDRRHHRGNWCNQEGGVGFKPWPNPYPGIDAFVWVKPQGESDGISDPNFAIDPNDPNKKHDGMCDPLSFNTWAPSASTGAMDNAPHAGRWFPEAFQALVANAFPLATDPAGPPPPPPPPPSDCEGLDPANPLVVNGANNSVIVDLRCEAPIYLSFATTPKQVFFDNDGDAFDVTVDFGGSTQVVSGHFVSVNTTTTSLSITRNADARSMKVRYSD